MRDLVKQVLTALQDPVRLLIDHYRRQSHMLLLLVFPHRALTLKIISKVTMYY